MGHLLFLPDAGISHFSNHVKSYQVIGTFSFLLSKYQFIGGGFSGEAVGQSFTVKVQY